MRNAGVGGTAPQRQHPETELTYNRTMRPLLSMAAFVVFLALLPVSAQRGGMRSSGGGHVGVGHPSGGHAFAGMRSSGMRGGLGVRPSFSRGGFGRDGFGRVRIRNRPFFRHCFGCFNSFASPWLGWGYPFGWWDSSSGYDYDREQEQETALARQMDAMNMLEQNLRQREDSLQQREEQDSYARQQAREEARSAVSPSTVLVFRDQHQQEIRNYAIAGDTLWVLSDHVLAKKIPLTDLDLEATTKANDQRGVEFQVPR